MQDQTNALVQIAQYFPVVGWPTICALAWKIGRWFTKTEDQAKQAFDTLKNNDLHHIQLGLDAVLAAIQGLQSTTEKQTDALVSELREQRADIRTLLVKS